MIHFLSTLFRSECSQGVNRECCLCRLLGVDGVGEDKFKEQSGIICCLCFWFGRFLTTTSRLYLIILTSYIIIETFCMLRVTQSAIVCFGGIWCRWCWTEACRTSSSKSCSKSLVKHDWTRFTWSSRCDCRSLIQEENQRNVGRKSKAAQTDSVWFDAGTKHTHTHTHTSCVFVKSARGYRGRRTSQTEGHDVWILLNETQHLLCFLSEGKRRCCRRKPAAG